MTCITQLSRRFTSFTHLKGLFRKQTFCFLMVHLGLLGKYEMVCVI
jgi:hypothetical protein